MAFCSLRNMDAKELRFKASKPTVRRKSLIGGGSYAMTHKPQSPVSRASAPQPQQGWLWQGLKTLLGLVGC